MENSDSTEIVRKRVATNPSENVHLKRSRIKPNRLGVASTNKDNYFEMDKSQDSTEETTSQQSESDFVESADESDSFKENELSTPDNGVYRRQMSRFEAKLDHIQTVVVQIQRMCITSKVGDKIEHFKHFSELPLKTVMQIEDFEAKLVQDEYRKDIFEYLALINGVAGDKAGSKIIRSIVFATVCRQVLSKYTWTGKSAKRSTKLNFVSKKNMVRLFFDVVHCYDEKYTIADCEDDLKYKIFKYTYKESVPQVALVETNTADSNESTATTTTTAQQATTSVQHHSHPATQLEPIHHSSPVQPDSMPTIHQQPLGQFVPTFHGGYHAPSGQYPPPPSGQYPPPPSGQYPPPPAGQYPPTQYQYPSSQYSYPN